MGPDYSQHPETEVSGTSKILNAEYPYAMNIFGVGEKKNKQEKKRKKGKSTPVPSG